MTTIADMGKKKDATSHADEPKWQQINLRIDDPRLLSAIDGWADKNRRSRNMAIILLLERMLTNEKMWPPADSKD